MTWAEFKASVRVLLTIDGNRVGIQDYIDRQILQAVISLQRYIPYYRPRTRTTYSNEGRIAYSDPVTADGSASLGEVPAVGALFREGYFIQGTEDFDCPDENEGQCLDDNDTCQRIPLENYPWSNRFDLTCGRVPVNQLRAFMSISEDGAQVLIYPLVTDMVMVEVYWDNVVSEDFEESDTMGNLEDERVIAAVAAFTKSRVVREVEKDYQASASYEKDWLRGRRELWQDAKDKTFIRNTKGSGEAVQSQPIAESEDDGVEDA